MRKSLALRRYLERYIEADLPTCPAAPDRWRQVIVVPAYREAASLLTTLAALPGRQVLVILVLNRPASDPSGSANQELRLALQQYPRSEISTDAVALYRLNENIELLAYDLEQCVGPTPTSQGVGLARKLGCDIALLWHQQRGINSAWICCTDADAKLPADYFQRLSTVASEKVAAVFPFHHVKGADTRCNLATALYELRLHQYVLGLEYAGSPYAYHSLGSALAVRPAAYAAVRGFPRRSGGEDFYLLSKLAKTGPIARLTGRCVELQSRSSQRVPFGTGPAVARIAATADLERQRIFNHPACFEALRAILLAVHQLAAENASAAQFARIVAKQLQNPALVVTGLAVLQSLGIEAALAHCRRQSTDQNQFLRQFHQWFDAFRSLKFIHGIQNSGWPGQSLAEIARLTPSLWPSGSPISDVEALRAAIRAYRGWEIDSV